MGYYVRVLGIRDPDISVFDLKNALEQAGLSGLLDIDDTEQPDKWTLLDVANTPGEPLTRIERNAVVEGELGKDELDEFITEINDKKPASAVEWLSEYLKKVKVIYAFRILHAAFDDGKFAIVDVIRNLIRQKTGGILQADGEGFSNEDGYHILWQFSDTVDGEWSCAVRNLNGEWINFRMDLGDLQQRAEFQAGKVPRKAIAL